MPASINISGGQESIGSWLTSYFEIDESNVASITAARMNLYADLAHLVVEARDTVDVLQGFGEEDLNAFQEPIDEIASVISSNSPQQHIGRFRYEISAETLKALDFYSRILNQQKPDATLSATQIQELLGQTQELINSIIAAELDANLKAILLDHLAIVEKALRLYAIVGGTGLRRAAAGLEGSSLFAWIDNPDEKAKPFIQKCGSLGLQIANLVGFAANLFSALQGAEDKIPELMTFLHHASQNLPQLSP